MISVLALTGATTGVVLATVGGKPAKLTGLSAPVPRSSPTPTRSTGPVVPMLGGNADGSGTPLAVPVARTTAPSGGRPSSGRGTAPASTAPASTAPASTGPASTGPTGTGPNGTAPTGTGPTGASPADTGPADPGPSDTGPGGGARTQAVGPLQSVKSGGVAPLRGLKRAGLLVVAPFSLSRQVLNTVARQPGVTGAEPIEAAKIKINGAFTAVLGVNPSRFRGYAAKSMASSNRLWQGIAAGGVAVSYTMGTLDKLSLGGRVTVAGHQTERLPVVAFGTVGIGGVDAVVSDSVARSLGVPAGNAIIVSAPPSSVASLTARIKAILPKGAGVEALVTVVTRAGATSPVGTAPSAAGGSGGVSASQLTDALRAAESRKGLPYVWGATGPRSFDCSGLVQWSFAQAGITMPRVAADQARAGLAVSASQLQPGDLLFYHTDPTDPGYISHVAIYLGNGWMIQAPQPGMDVEIIPASFGSQFAGAVRVYPRIAAGVASGLA
ncbi:MAG TPA: NlpC/P60 family protein [Streptosporangiaceae bacterium]|nr:NlpC/P60 family protein [Streptosporangiaceae bacterium]